MQEGFSLSLYLCVESLLSLMHVCAFMCIQTVLSKCLYGFGLGL